MPIIDKILGVFEIRGRESIKVLDKICDSLDFGWEGRDLADSNGFIKLHNIGCSCIIRRI